MTTTVISGHLFSCVQDLKDLEYLLIKLDTYEVPPIPPTIPTGGTVIEKLIMANQDVWTDLLNNKFCDDGYKSSADNFNPIYRGFATASITPSINQDYKYLIEYVRFVNYRALQQPNSHTEEGLREMVKYLPKKVDDVEAFFNTCVNDMEIKKQDLQNERISPQILGYTAWEQMYGMTDDVYSNYIRMIPCIYGWNQIAHKLEIMESGVTGTYFWKYWFEESIKDGSAIKLNKYLEDNLPSYDCKANWEKWNIAFRQACLFEIAFFDAALNKNIPS